MTAVHIVAVGKLKDAWLRDGCAEYQKRLRLWCTVTLTEVEECRLPDEPSPAEIAAGIEREGERIAAKLPKNAAVVALCIEGELRSSEQLAQFFARAAVGGTGTVAFVIGGSHGLSDRIKSRAALRLSISPMTFPHQLARVMLCEQIYRAFSINNNGKYHK